MLVQFGNNWIQKIQLFPNWTACSPIIYTKTTAVSRKKNRAKINDECDIREKKQNSSNQTAETAVL